MKQPLPSHRTGLKLAASRGAAFAMPLATLLGCGSPGLTPPTESSTAAEEATWSPRAGDPTNATPSAQPSTPVDQRVSDELADSEPAPESEILASPSEGSSIQEGNPQVSGEVSATDADLSGTDPSPPDDITEPELASPLDDEAGECPPLATASDPIGYGENTTGAGDAEVVVVDSFEAAEQALAQYRSAFKEGSQAALHLRYIGRFDFSTIDDVCEQHEKPPRRLQIKEMDNVTFEGAPGSSANFGLHINRAHNVIVSNMTIGLLPGGGDSDAITIEGNGTNGDVEHVWIDHNELFSSTKDDCPGAGDTEFDGLLDIKKGARFITVSHNYLHDHQKTGLLGFSDSDDTERYVTFHGNRYENIVSRTPLLRYGYVHLFNNYFGNISGSGINARMGAIALIEANFFEFAANPITSRFSPEPGFWDLRNNHVGDGITWTVDDDTLANADDWQSTVTFPSGELNYDYPVLPAACVQQAVFTEAGATL